MAVFFISNASAAIAAPSHGVGVAYHVYSLSCIFLPFFSLWAA